CERFSSSVRDQAAATMLAAIGGCLSGVKDQLFLVEELEGAVAFHVHRITECSVDSREDGNDHAVLVIVGRFFDPFANRKFGHRMFLLESCARDYPPEWLTVLKQMGGKRANLAGG